MVLGVRVGTEGLQKGKELGRERVSERGRPAVGETRVEKEESTRPRPQGQYLDPV